MRINEEQVLLAQGMFHLLSKETTLGCTAADRAVVASPALLVKAAGRAHAAGIAPSRASLASTRIDQG
jgi:hypothetical protein